MAVQVKEGQKEEQRKCELTGLRRTSKGLVDEWKQVADGRRERRYVAKIDQAIMFRQALNMIQCFSHSAEDRCTNNKYTLCKYLI